MADDGEATFEFYAATVEELVEGRWTAIFTEKSAFGRSANDCAVNLLDHTWPVSIYKDDTAAWLDRWRLLAGRADTVRVVLTPASHNGRGDAATLTLREVFILLLGQQAAEQQDRRRAAADARAALQKARVEANYQASRVRSSGYDMEMTERHMATAGMTPADIAAARKAVAPRRARAARKP